MDCRVRQRPKGSDSHPPEAGSYFPTNHVDPSAVQYSNVHPQQTSPYGLAVPMQRLTDHPQRMRPRDRDSRQRLSVTTQRPNDGVSHIASLSKQDDDYRVDSHVERDSAIGPINSTPAVAVNAISYSDWRAQTTHEDTEHGEDVRSAGSRPSKNDPSRMKDALQRSSGNLTSASQAPTMEALTNAIRKGLHPSDPIQRPELARTRTDPMVRLPFQGDPDSPSSTYTDMTTSYIRPQSIPTSTYQGYDPHDSRPSTIHEHEAEDYDRSGIDGDLATPTSINPIFANEHPGMSSKIPASKRPPKLDITAVREMESRGSITSLSDLIRRATRLATNLDKGKTASRLGLLDFLGGNEKLGDREHRNSSFSDVLDSFPVAGTPIPDRPTTMWPDGQKQRMSKAAPEVQKEAPEAEKKKRRCCGMSPLWFSIVSVILFLLVAAAVLIPVFLIVLPHTHPRTDSSTCSTSHSCSNEGFSVAVNNVCSCICVNGFTGSDCSMSKNPDCTVYDLQGDIKTFNNVTVGTSVLSTFNSAQSSLNINVNQTRLLSIFANTNLSCTSENSLVEFGSMNTVKSKRYVMLPGMMRTDQHGPALNLPAAESKEHRRFFMVDEDGSEGLGLIPSRVVKERENTISSNGIIFATSTNVAVSQATSQTTTASAPAATFAGITDKQIAFAGTVVLYVLQTFEQINVAVAANQAIASYFKATDRRNSTVGVVSGSQRIDANFDKLQILLANGTVLGGS